MAFDHRMNLKDVKPSHKRTAGEKSSNMANSSGRFAELAPKRPRDGASKSVADRMKPSASKEQVCHKLTVAELMKKTDEASACAEEKQQRGSRARDEVFSEVKAVLDTNGTLQLADFDYRIRQHLHAMLGSGGRQKLHDALKAINEATSNKSRRDVKNWPAYLRKLLTKFEEELTSRNREARAAAERATARPRVEKGAAESGIVGKGTDSKSATPDELSEEDEEEAWLSALDGDLCEKDQWLKDLSTMDVKQSTPPPPPTEAPPPPPKELVERRRETLRLWQQSLQSTAPPQHPPMVAAAQSAPMTPPMKPSTGGPPLTPPPALPPSMMGHNLPKDLHVQPASKPPTAPPRASPEAYLRVPLREMQSQALHRQHNQAACATEPNVASQVGSGKPASLDFPLDAWAAWLHFPPQHVAAN